MEDCKCKCSTEGQGFPSSMPDKEPTTTTTKPAKDLKALALDALDPLAEKMTELKVLYDRVSESAHVLEDAESNFLHADADFKLKRDTMRKAERHTMDLLQYKAEQFKEITSTDSDGVCTLKDKLLDYLVALNEFYAADAKRSKREGQFNKADEEHLENKNAFDNELTHFNNLCRAVTDPNFTMPDSNPNSDYQERDKNQLVKQMLAWFKGPTF